MVILHISSIKNSLYNGVCIVVPQYVEYQLQAGNEVALVNINGESIKQLHSQIPVNGNICIERLPKPFSKPDIVVFQECYRVGYLKIAQELRKKHIPYVIIPHGELADEAQENKHLKKKMANMFFFKPFIDNAVAIQTLSEREYTKTHFGRKKIVATNGVAIPVEKKQSFNTDRIQFIYIGRLDAYHKGLDLLIEAISHIKQTLINANARLDIYGPDVEGRKEYLKKLIVESKLCDIICVHDKVSGEEKKRIILNADIFIQTSRFEGMPLGILEAMSYGLPCLVSDGTTLAQSVELNQAGWRAGMSIDDIKTAIITCIDQKTEWQTFGNNARRFVETEYNWNAITEKTINYYRELI